MIRGGELREGHPVDEDVVRLRPRGAEAERGQQPTGETTAEKLERLTTRCTTGYGLRELIELIGHGYVLSRVSNHQDRTAIPSSRRG